MLSSAAGTGDWEEYSVLYKCGTDGTFSSGGHIAITGSNNTSVTWYLAYVNDCDITSDENLKNYSILKNKTKIKNGYLFDKEINCSNILPNGDCFKQENSMLPNGWSYDTSDYAGNSKCSLV